MGINGSIGFHLLNVSVRDNEVLRDWQIVKILVNDMPEVDLKGSNQFIDVPNNFASIEDPYKLDGSGTVVFFERGLSYKFIDSREGPIASGPSSIAYVPDLDPDIEDIVPYLFSVTGLHSIRLVVSDNMGAGATGVGFEVIDIDVKECLPHRSDAASYPFNMIPDDGYPDLENPFQANHTCCDDNFMIKEGTELCYETVKYGCYSDLWHQKIVDVDDFNTFVFESVGTLGDDNDVHNATYKRKCDGERGNTCLGGQKTFVSLQDECHDECQYCELGKDSCQPKSTDTKCDDEWKCSQGNDAIY